MNQDNQSLSMGHNKVKAKEEQIKAAILSSEWFKGHHDTPRWSVSLIIPTIYSSE